MKKTFIILLALTFILTAISGAAGKSENIILKGEGAASNAAVIYPENCNDLIKQYAEVLAERLSTITGAEVVATNVTSSTVPKIFIGEPYEEDIDAFLDEIKAQNGGLLPFILESEEDWEKFCGYRNAYSVEVENSNLHIKGSDEYTLYCAIEDFLNEVRSSETYVLENGYKYVTPDEHIFKDPNKAIETGNAYLHAAEPVAILPYEYMPYVDAMQGGGTDGEFAYYCGRNDAYSRIFRYNLNTWELDYVSEPVHSRHSNDITYLPESDTLMICHCEDEENNSQGVTYVDAETMKENLDTLLPVWASRFEYRADREKYYILKADYVYVLDKDLNVLSEQRSEDTRGTPQGCCTDEKYLYDIRWDVEGDGRLYDHALIYDLDTMKFQFAAELTGYDEELEPENIFKDETVFYICFHHIKYGNLELGTVYRFVLIPATWWAE